MIIEELVLLKLVSRINKVINRIDRIS